MLFELRSIMHGHVPPAEVDDAGAKRQMQIVKRSTFAHSSSPNNKRQAQDARPPPPVLEPERSGARCAAPLRWAVALDALKPLSRARRERPPCSSRSQPAVHVPERFRAELAPSAALPEAELSLNRLQQRASQS